ncbi:MAG TPA: C40 family peptidase [Negativicutes bacterium]|jgi:cell wall-associated NlpC family hydrolase
MRNFLSILLLAVTLISWQSVGYATDFASHPTQGQTRVSVEKETKRQKQPAKGKDIVRTAMIYKGVPYRFGGSSPKGFDCSGFVWYIFDKHGKKLPRTTDKQFEVGKPVRYKELLPGDVVFFTTYAKGATHCGIFIEGGKFIHASSSHGIMISSLGDSYWKPKYLGARRMLELQ